jgi:membrane protein
LPWRGPNPGADMNVDDRGTSTPRDARKTVPSGASLSSLIRSLGRDAGLLIRQEAALLRAELKAAARGVGRAVSVMGGGVGILGLAVLVLLAALVVGLGVALQSYWLSALIVGAVLLLAGGILVYLGVRALRSPRPEETLASIRATRNWGVAELRRVRAAIRRPGPSVDLPRLETGQPGRPAAQPTPLRIRRAAPDERTASVAERHERRREGLEESRGHGAASSPGSKAFWIGVKDEFTEENVPGLAAQVAYYAFLSLPPTLMVVFALTGLIGGEPVALWLTENLTQILPEDASELVEGFVQQVVYESAPGPLSIGLLIALWAASNVFVALADTLNRAYGLKPRTSFIRKRLAAIGVMLGAALLFIAGSAALLAGPSIAGWIGIGTVGATVWTILQWPLALLLVVGAFWIVYFFLPARDQWAEKSRILKGALAGALLWLVATMGFRFYIENFGQYTETYGFLGTIIVLLIWLYVTSLVVILGGIINSQMSRSSAGS